MTDPMVAMIAKRFIHRRDVKAMQTYSGAYIPVCAFNPDTGKNDGARLPWMTADITAHINRAATYGHYLVDTNDQCKLFAFDIDLEKNREPTPAEPNGWSGTWVEFPDLTNLDGEISEAEFHGLLKVHQTDVRKAWLDRAHPARPWLKYQLRMVGEKIARVVAEEFEIPVAMAYSGGKGIHVYGFTGPIKASEAREAAETVLALTGEFELFRGKNFFRHKNQDPYTGYPNISIEIFPKQDSLNGKDLGNLMRLPLGRNLKSNDPTFFVDQRLPMHVIAPHPDPIGLLESGKPWS